MKLRISKQSLRFRLNPRDMEELKALKTLNREIHLTSDMRWGYDLALANIEDTQVLSRGSRIEVQVPEEKFLSWLASPEIAWNHQQQSPDLLVSIEKDLKPHRG